MEKHQICINNGAGHPKNLEWTSTITILGTFFMTIINCNFIMNIAVTVQAMK